MDKKLTKRTAEMNSLQNELPPKMNLIWTPAQNELNLNSRRNELPPKTNSRLIWTPAYNELPLNMNSRLKRTPA